MLQDATFAGCGPEFAAPCFRRKLMCSIKLRLFLSGLGWGLSHSRVVGGSAG